MFQSLDRSGHHPGFEDRFDPLLAAAQLECALGDVWFPERDDITAASEAAIELSRHAARRYLFGNGHPFTCVSAAAWRRLGHAVAAQTHPLPVTNPEGVRFYALAPASYAASARRWQRLAPRAEPAWVLGLRTMGSLLAPVAAEALRPAALPHRCTTLRPRGHPFGRSIRTSPRLRAALAAWPGSFLIADEGPGLSGSSFAGTVAFLLELGCGLERIALLTSWDPSPAEIARLRSLYAAAHWQDWRVFPAPPLPAPGSRGRAPIEISGGEWRRRLPGRRHALAWEQHERRKFLADFIASPSRPSSFVKFAGLGVHGRRTRELAEQIANAGWGPALAPAEPGDAGSGWLRYRLAPARPLPAHLPSAWAEWAGRYLAWRRAELALARAPEIPSPALRAMLQANLLELFGTETGIEPVAAVPVLADGRTLRGEWGATDSGWVKFDATDHGDDMFFPGPADIAWDLAAMEVEFPHASPAVIAAYRRASGERQSRLEPRLRWHRLAYALFRGAYWSLAAAQTSGAERSRLLSEARRYRRFCRAALGAGAAFTSAGCAADRRWR